MTAATSTRITKLQFKNEGENGDGIMIGHLTDQHAQPVFPDGHWITKQEALRIARDLGVELFEY